MKINIVSINNQTLNCCASEQINHKQAHFYLIYSSASAKLCSEDEEIEINRNEIAFFGSLEKIFFIRNDFNCPVKIVLITFRIAEQKVHHVPFVKISVPDQSILELFMQLTTITTGDEITEEMIQLLEDLIIVLIKLFNNQKNGIEGRVMISEHLCHLNSRLVKVKRYINDNYDQPLTLKELSELIQCSPIYLSNSFTKLFKVSPIKYLQIVRMEQAYKMLLGSSDSVTEIALKVGYVSVSQFCALFKRHYNITPLQCRNEVATEWIDKELSYLY